MNPIILEALLESEDVKEGFRVRSRVEEVKGEKLRL